MKEVISHNQKALLKNKVKTFYKQTRKLRDEDQCPIKNILTPTLDKWSISCMYNLAFNEVLRFNQLKKYIPGISSRMLSVTLKRMEGSGLVSRQLHAEVPPKVEYRLTDFGYGFCERILALNHWVMHEKNLV